MSAPTFRIITDWRVKGRLADVVRLLTKVEDFPRWWGNVHAAVVPRGPDTFAVRSRAILPLRWQARVIEAAPPHRFVIEASGGLAGRGIWHLRQAGDVVEIEFDWQPAHRPRLGWLTVWSHRRAMSCGQSALRAEMARINRIGTMSGVADHTTLRPGLPAVQ